MRAHQRRRSRAARRPATRACSPRSRATRRRCISRARSRAREGDARPRARRVRGGASPRRRTSSTRALAARSSRWTSARPTTRSRSCAEGLARAPRASRCGAMLGRARARAARGRRGAEALRARRSLIAPADADVHFNHGVALQTQRRRAGRRARLPARADVRARLRRRRLQPRRAVPAAGQRAGGARRLSHGARRRTRRTSRPTRTWARCCSPPARSTPGSRTSARFEQHCPNALPLAVQALEACQYTATSRASSATSTACAGTTSGRATTRSSLDCLEELLYLLLFFDVEPAMMLRFAQTYDSVARAGLRRRRCRGPPARRPGTLRIGYLSADLRNHVMGKMMWQAVAHHDRDRFDLYFYSMSRERDEWTERFAGAGKRFDVIAALDDAEAAQRIADDDLDMLVDLSTHTRGARPGILALKPARVQVTHVASAGTVGLVGDRLQAHRPLRGRAREPGVPDRAAAARWTAACIRTGTSRRRSGIRSTARRSASPRTRSSSARSSLRSSCRAAACACGATCWSACRARSSPSRPPTRRCARSYVRLAAAAGIGEDRLLFLPQGRDDAENQARYHVVDFVLDTMPFGGVNGTIEALDMGVPVVTLVGKRHGERTSYSILRNLGVAATIATIRTRVRGHRGAPRRRCGVPRGRARSRSARASRIRRSSTCARTRAISRPRTCGRSPSARRTPCRRADAMADPRLASIQARLAAGDAAGARSLADALLRTPRSRRATASRRWCCARAPTRRCATSRRRSPTSRRRSRSIPRRRALERARARVRRRGHERPRDRRVRARDARRSRLRARVEQPRQCAAHRGPHRRGGPRVRARRRGRSALRARVVEPGRAERDAGDDAGAEVALRRALALDANLRGALTTLAGLLRERGDLDGAARALRARGRSSTRATRTRCCSCAGTLAERDDLDGARAAYAEAGARDPRMLRALFGQ